MTSLIATLLLIALLGGVVALLEHNHRLNRGWPQLPPGSEIEPQLRMLWMQRSRHH